MTISIEYASGTETVSTTEHSLTTDTAGPDVNTDVGTYQGWLDLSALAAGDVFEFRVYEKVRTGATQRTALYARFNGAQSVPLWFIPAMMLGVGWDMTLLKVSGTDRAIEWRISRAT